MLNRFPYRTLALAWLSLAAIGWLVAVPHWLSLANLAWLNATGLMLSATVLSVQRAGRPSRSIAGMLYDTDQSTGQGR